MANGNDELIQTASGFWIPKQAGPQRSQQAQQPRQEVQQDSGHVQDWKAHWQMQGQSWRREPEVDQERQRFLQQGLEIQPDEKQYISPFFEEVSLTRADLEWLVQEHKEKSAGDEEQQQGLDLQNAILGNVDCEGLPLEGTRFRSAQLKEAYFRSAQLKEAYFRSAQLEGAYFRSAQLEGAYFQSAQLEGANFEDAQLEGADFQSARIANASFANAAIVTAQGIGPIVADVTGWDERSFPIREWSKVKQLGDEAIAKKEEILTGTPKMQQSAMKSTLRQHVPIDKLQQR